ncbi:MAG: hypothetical protein RI894_1667 [Bacteroidota bacterium]|jgi:predicted ATPase
MKILKIIIPNFQQFRDFELDLTHPDTGETLEKVCFIGSNGTGKSTLLNILNTFLKFLKAGQYEFNWKLDSIISFELDGKMYYCSIFNGKIVGLYEVQKLKEARQDIEFIDTFKNSIKTKGARKIDIKTKIPVYQEYDLFMDKYKFFSIDLSTSGKDLHYPNRQKIKIGDVIYSPAESIQNNLLAIDDVPKTNVDEALNVNKNKSYYIVSNETVTDFWTQLIALIKEREGDLKTFAQENKKKTYEEIEAEFDKDNPEILKEIAAFWNKILDKSNLYFDYENAKNPIQLLDNLQAYIKNKHTHEIIPYNALSTGIRNFMFRLGHIYSLYFNKTIDSGFLLVDEPENSLFPDFLYDLIDIYLDIIKDKNTQFFVATHNPIIAAQFEPFERVILRFDESGFVQAHRGQSPVGDDPNDLLENDFEVRNLMPRQGREAFKQYQDLRRQLRELIDDSDKEGLMTKISILGQKYNF